MIDLEVCPFCDTAGHKVMHFSNGVFYCKECQRFFSLKIAEPKCPKCGSKKIRHSEFPMPSGEAVFHCDSCKKNYSSKEFFAASMINYINT